MARVTTGTACVPQRIPGGCDPMSSSLHPYVQCAPSCNPVRPRLQPLTLTLGAPGTYQARTRHGVRVRSESFPGYHPSPLTPHPSPLTPHPSPLTRSPRVAPPQPAHCPQARCVDASGDVVRRAPRSPSRRSRRTQRERRGAGGGGGGARDRGDGGGHSGARLAVVRV